MQKDAHPTPSPSHCVFFCWILFGAHEPDTEDATRMRANMGKLNASANNYRRKKARLAREDVTWMGTPLFFVHHTQKNKARHSKPSIGHPSGRMRMDANRLHPTCFTSHPRLLLSPLHICLDFSHF